NVAPGEDDEAGEGGDKPQARQPPDLPDQREPGYRGEDGGVESDRGMDRHLDRAVLRLRPQPLAYDRLELDPPIGFLALDIRGDGEVEEWRRGGGRPFEAAAVPGIPGRIAQTLALADGDDQHDDLADHADRQHADARRGKIEHRGPLGLVHVLEAPCHALQAEHVEGRESDPEPEERKPERGLAPALVKAEPEGLGKPEIEP